MQLLTDTAELLGLTGTAGAIHGDLLKASPGFNSSDAAVVPSELGELPVTATVAVAVGVLVMAALVFDMVYCQRKKRAEHCDKNEGLWVIAGSVYDLKPFMDRHPGGRYILEATQGRDCSAMFHSYHATSAKPIGTMLEKYYVRAAKPSECVDSKIWDFNDMPFYSELQSEIQKEMGRERRNVKASIAHLTQYVVFSVLMITSLRSWLLGSTAGGVVFGLMIWFCSGDILHASTHYAVFETAEINLLAGWLFGWLHHVPSMWVRQHVLGHHAYTNVPGLDPDLDHFRQFSKLQGGWRLTDTQHPRKSYLNWRYSMAPIMAITGIGPLVGESLQAMVTGYYMRHIKLQPVRGEMMLSVLQLTMAVFMGLILPYYMNGSVLHVLLPYTVHGFLYYGFSAVSHSNSESQSNVWGSGKDIVQKDRYITRVKGRESGSSAPDAAAAGSKRSSGQQAKPVTRKEWAAHQIETSKGDYAPGSIFWGLMALGLNNQALHHTFPGIHPCHYYYLSPVLRRVCDKHGVDYHTHPTFWDAFKSHLRHVSKLNDSLDIIDLPPTPTKTTGTPREKMASKQGTSSEEEE
eukprot:SAG31_NODE_4339_length_3340_cov_4.899389_3_plen_576_part_00